MIAGQSFSGLLPLAPGAPCDQSNSLDGCLVTEAHDAKRRMPDANSIQVRPIKRQRKSPAPMQLGLFLLSQMRAVLLHGIREIHAQAQYFLQPADITIDVAGIACHLGSRHFLFGIC